MRGEILKKLGVLFMVLVLGSTLFAMQGKGTDYRRDLSSLNELKSLVESKSFLFKAEYAYKRSGERLKLTKGYDLRLNDNFAACWLPSLDIVTGFRSDLDVEPLQFREYSENMGVQFDHRNSSYNVYFEVKPSGNMMQFKLQILPDKSASLVVYFENRECIRIEGFVEDVNRGYSI